MTNGIESEFTVERQQEYPMDASNFKFAIPCYLSLKAKYDFLKWRYQYLAECALAENTMYINLINTLKENLPAGEQG